MSAVLTEDRKKQSDLPSTASTNLAIAANYPSKTEPNARELEIAQLKEQLTKELASNTDTILIDNPKLLRLIELDAYSVEDTINLKGLILQKDPGKDELSRLLAAMQKNIEYRAEVAKKINRTRSEYPNVMRHLTVKTNGVLGDIVAMLSNPDSLFETASFSFPSQPTIPPVDAKGKADFDITQAQLKATNNARTNLENLVNFEGHKLNLWQLSFQNGHFKISKEFHPTEKRSRKKRGAIPASPTEPEAENRVYNYAVLHDLALGLQKPNYSINSLSFTAGSLSQGAMMNLCSALDANLPITELRLINVNIAVAGVAYLVSVLKTKKVPFRYFELSTRATESLSDFNPNNFDISQIMQAVIEGQKVESLVLYGSFSSSYDSAAIRNLSHTLNAARPATFNPQISFISFSDAIDGISAAQVIPLPKRIVTASGMLIEENNNSNVNNHNTEVSADGYSVIDTCLPRAKRFTLPTRTPLTELDLSHSAFPKEITKSLFKFLKHNIWLKKLKYNACMGKNDVDIIAEYIANCLENNPSLTSLELDDNFFGTSKFAIKVLCRALISRKKCALQELSLRWNLLRRESLGMIADVLE